MSQQMNGRRPAGGGGMPMGGPMGRGGFGQPVEKAKNFGGTFRRLIGYFAPFKWSLIVVVITAVIGSAFNIVGPKILGLATTRLAEGLIEKYKTEAINQMKHLELPVP